MRRILALFVILPVLSSCDFGQSKPQLSEIKLVEFPSSSPTKEEMTGEIQIGLFKNSLSSDQIKANLENNGFNLSKEENYEFAYAYGRYGNDVKVVFAKNSLIWNFNAKSSLETDFIGRGNTDKAEISMEASYFSGRISSASVYANYGTKYGFGPEWRQVREQIIKDAGKSIGESLPQNIQNSNGFSFNLNSDGSLSGQKGPILYSISVDQCGQSRIITNESVSLTELQQSSSELNPDYNQHVCGLSITYTDTRSYEWAKSADKLMEPELVHTFVQPDCLGSDPKCFADLSKEELSALRSAMGQEIMTALRK